VSRVESPTPSASALIEPVFSLPVRVYYEDTDAAGVVYYANYLRFLERARTEWLAAIGHPVAELERVHGIVFVVRRIEIDYRLPARLSDALDVTFAIETLGRASLTVQQRVLRGSQTLLTARVMLACVDRERMKPARIPVTLKTSDPPESKR
jgi:acyl-CoA thioester hydrolase